MQNSDEFELQILLEEYKSCRREIENYVSWQYRIISMGIAGVGIFISIAISRSPICLQSYGWIFLLGVFFISLLGMTTINIDGMILDLANYQDEFLKPRLSKICNNKVLLWHSFRTEQYHKQKDIALLKKLFRLSPMLFSPPGFFIFLDLIFIIFVLIFSSSLTEFWMKVLLSIDVIFFVLFSLNVYRQHRRYFPQNIAGTNKQKAL